MGRRGPPESDLRDAAVLRRRLLSWWRASGRSFPWRDTRQAYRVLVAEVLLHRTRASQVAPLYLRFVRRFRSWQSVARTSLQEVRRVLRPIGLTWRVDEFHRMAREIVKRFGGRTPRSRADLESLPGIGHYKAAAVRCFAYGEREILLDTNTVRVLSRLRGIKRTDASRRSQLYRKEMSRLIGGHGTRDLNLALLDLAALVCHPARPDCERCPIGDHCSYGRRHLRAGSTR